MKCTAVIPAAGVGKRMGKDQKKQYIHMNHKPILAYTLETFEKSKWIDEIIIVTNKDEIQYCQREIIDKYQFSKVKQIVEGGEERQQSVYLGLRAIQHTDLVVIHDGVRPFVSLLNIEESVHEAKKTGGAVVGVPVKDTIKRIETDGFINETLDRSQLWAIQTPQVFNYNILLDAHEKAKEDGYLGTDDAVLIEKYSNSKIKMVMGSYLNIKITTPEDLIVGKEIVKKY